MALSLLSKTLSRKALLFILSAIVIPAMVMLIISIWEWQQINRYNAALKQSNYAQAEGYLGDYGVFSTAFAHQQKGDYQSALISYASLDNSDNPALRKGALFNAANTYLQHAMKLDFKRDAEQVFPLLELAKESYRRVLLMDSKYWGAKYNLERALQLLPDAEDEVIITKEGYARLVRAVISAANEDELP